MKRVLVALMIYILLMSLFGCSNGQSAGNGDQSASDNHMDMVSTPPQGSDGGKEEYDENAIMFICQDRYDIEGDRNTVYQFNYKGELLQENDNFSYIGAYVTNDLIPAMDPVSGKIGYVDRDGVFVIEPRYDDATVFSPGGLATVMIRDEDYYIEYCGVIDTEGNEIVPCIYSDISNFFPSGYATYSVSDLLAIDTVYGIIDESGNIVVEVGDQKILYVYNGYFVTSNGVYDFSGTQLDERNMEYNADEDWIAYQIYKPYENALYKFTIRKPFPNKDAALPIIKQEIFNGSGFEEIETEYKISSKHVATTQSGVGYGVTVGEDAVIPFRYDAIYRIGNYFVGVIWNTDQSKRMIDIYDAEYNITAEGLNYSVVTPWDEGQNLPDGYFYVYKSDGEERLYGIINEAGEIIIEPVFYRGITYCVYENIANFPDIWW